MTYFVGNRQKESLEKLHYSMSNIVLLISLMKKNFGMRTRFLN